MAIEKQEKIRQAEEIGANTLKIEQLYTLKKREILEKEREERQKFEKASLDELNKLKLDELETSQLSKGWLNEDAPKKNACRLVLPDRFQLLSG